MVYLSTQTLKGSVSHIALEIVVQAQKHLPPQNPIAASSFYTSDLDSGVHFLRQRDMEKQTLLTGIVCLSLKRRFGETASILLLERRISKTGSRRIFASQGCRGMCNLRSLVCSNVDRLCVQVVRLGELKLIQFL